MMTSLTFSACASSITMRATPGAMPPCGGAPNLKAEIVTGLEATYVSTKQKSMSDLVSETGKPDQSMDAFSPFLKVIKQRSPAVINITTGGAMTMTVEERAQPAIDFKPEVASLNMGTMNFGLYPMLNRFKEFKFDWERTYLEGSKSGFFKNTFADIEYILTQCAENGTRFEVECYDIGHLYTLAHMADREIIKPPFFVQSVFGILGGIGTHEEDVAHMRRTADRLFGDDYQWSVLAAGRHQMRIAALAAAMGGNDRVGLED